MAKYVVKAPPQKIEVAEGQFVLVNKVSFRQMKLIKNSDDDPENLLRLLKEQIVGWEGFCDADGRPVAFDITILQEFLESDVGAAIEFAAIIMPKLMPAKPDEAATKN